MEEEKSELSQKVTIGKKLGPSLHNISSEGTYIKKNSIFSGINGFLKSQKDPQTG